MIKLFGDAKLVDALVMQIDCERWECIYRYDPFLGLLLLDVMSVAAQPA